MAKTEVQIVGALDIGFQRIEVLLVDGEITEAQADRLNLQECTKALVSASFAVAASIDRVTAKLPKPRGEGEE